MLAQGNQVLRLEVFRDDTSRSGRIVIERQQSRQIVDLVLLAFSGIQLINELFEAGTIELFLLPNCHGCRLKFALLRDLVCETARYVQEAIINGALMVYEVTIELCL